MIFHLLVATVWLAGFVAIAWAVGPAVSEWTAGRWRPRYTGLDLDEAFRIVWLGCPGCQVAESPHESDGEAGVLRCVFCGHLRSREVTR
ncbi:hypothetical protein [Streptomyces sp. NPDC001404]|uniref:hypothetical protein n=1 Tax=Streptomyces sp. NPDC001404 TaxID=3364571 RepID=UPI0036CE9820